jgi:hypothetical protein
MTLALRIDLADLAKEDLEEMKHSKEFSKRITEIIIKDMELTRQYGEGTFESAFFIENTFEAKKLARSMFYEVCNEVFRKSFICYHKTALALEKPCRVGDYSEMSCTELTGRNTFPDCDKSDYCERFVYLRAVLRVVSRNGKLNKIIRFSMRCRLFSWIPKNSKEQTFDFYWRPDFAEIDLEDKEIEKEINLRLGSIRFKFSDNGKGDKKEVKITKKEIRPGHRVSPPLTFLD